VIIPFDEYFEFFLQNVYNFITFIDFYSTLIFNILYLNNTIVVNLFFCIMNLTGFIIVKEVFFKDNEIEVEIKGDIKDIKGGIKDEVDEKKGNKKGGTDEKKGEKKDDKENDTDEKKGEKKDDKENDDGLFDTLIDILGILTGILGTLTGIIGTLSGIVISVVEFIIEILEGLVVELINTCINIITFWVTELPYFFINDLTWVIDWIISIIGGFIKNVVKEIIGFFKKIIIFLSNVRGFLYFFVSSFYFVLKIFYIKFLFVLVLFKNDIFSNDMFFKILAIIVQLFLKLSWSKYIVEILKIFLFYFIISYSIILFLLKFEGWVPIFYSILNFLYMKIIHSFIFCYCVYQINMFLSYIYILSTILVRHNIYWFFIKLKAILLVSLFLVYSIISHKVIYNLLKYIIIFLILFCEKKIFNIILYFLEWIKLQFENKLFFLNCVNFFYKFICINFLNFFIILFLSCFFFISSFFFRILFFIVLCWFFFMWLSRTFVFSYDTSFLMYDYKKKRKRIIYPLKVILRFFFNIYYKTILLICVFFTFKNIQVFLYLKFHNIFKFFFWYNTSILLCIYDILLACFLRLSYRRRLGLYIFNYRRVIVYCHWLGKKILGFNRKQVLFRWINLFLSWIQYLRYANLEKRRFFRSCYHFFINDFINIAFVYYFKRYILKLTRSLYYCFSRGNYILKKVRFFLNIFCNYVLLKYSFIHIRYKRFLLLIFIWNYSFLRFFIKYPLKLQLSFTCNKCLFKFKKKNNFYSCKINHYF